MTAKSSPLLANVAQRGWWEHHGQGVKSWLRRTADQDNKALQKETMEESVRKRFWQNQGIASIMPSSALISLQQDGFLCNWKMSTIDRGCASPLPCVVHPRLPSACIHWLFLLTDGWGHTLGVKSLSRSAACGVTEPCAGNIKGEISELLKLLIL